MGTLADLKTRIQSETTRDDLADDMATQFADIIRRSIDQYAAERWWFNERRTVTACTPGVDTVTPPTGTRWIDGLYLMQGGNTRWPIRRAHTDLLRLRDRRRPRAFRVWFGRTPWFPEIGGLRLLGLGRYRFVLLV